MDKKDNTPIIQPTSQSETDAIIAEEASEGPDIKHESNKIEGEDSVGQAYRDTEQITTEEPAGEGPDSQKSFEGFEGRLGDLANFASLSRNDQQGKDNAHKPSNNNSDKAQSPIKEGIDALSISDKKERSTNALSPIEHDAYKLIMTGGTHGVSLLCAARQLPYEFAERVQKNLEQLQEHEDETVNAQIEKGTLPATFVKTQIGLVSRNVDPSSITPMEAEKLLEFLRDDTPEAIEWKYETVSSTIEEVRNKLRFPHAQRYYNEGMKEYFEDLYQVLLQYDRGAYNDEYGEFDPLTFMVQRRVDRGEDYEELQQAISDGMDLSELCEADIIDRDHEVPVIGPFTAKDLGMVEVYIGKKWTIGNKSAGESLPERVVPGDTSFEDGLNRQRVAETILPNYRPSPKELLGIYGALGKEFLDVRSRIPAKESGTIAKAFHYAAAHVTKIISIRKEEVRQQFETERPITEEFFDEILALVEALPQENADSMNKRFNDRLEQLNQWVKRIEVHLEPYLVNEGQDAGRSTSSGIVFGLPDELSFHGVETNQ